MFEPDWQSGRARMLLEDHPFLGMGSPEFQDFAKQVIRAIADATKRLFRRLGAGIVAVWRYLERKAREGAEIHNRAQTQIDERYARNWFYLRGML